MREDDGVETVLAHQLAGLFLALGALFDGHRLCVVAQRLQFRDRRRQGRAFFVAACRLPVAETPSRRRQRGWMLPESGDVKSKGLL